MRKKRAFRASNRYHPLPYFRPSRVCFAITRGEALSYVKMMESKWRLRSSAMLVRRAELARDGKMYDVYTSENHWTVWREPNGTIYGEC